MQHLTSLSVKDVNFTSFEKNFLLTLQQLENHRPLQPLTDKDFSFQAQNSKGKWSPGEFNP
ncbi:hypothetical protein WN50_04825 [Limnoraphis robusta CS-951]|uniref:Uncharacterized protein n=1 Tax=Limnoraphis robusta CS-951 TaxID=1637645 RepID=A0A0F5YKI7_9CYAN|nr:hypothetical protein WN50_04825 [Limnoraphis robusta CS-951]